MRIPDPLKNNMYAELAKRNLKRQAVRTMLAAIGIIIGVMAISSMGILGNILKISATSSFSDINDKLIIYPTGGEKHITEKQAEQIRIVAGVEKVIPINSQGSKVEHRNEATYASVYSLGRGGIEGLAKINSGRFFGAGSTDCVVGSRIARSLKLDVGSKILLDNTTVRVVGILAEKGAGFDIDTDGGVFISTEMYKKMYPDDKDGYSNLIVRVRDSSKMDAVQKEIESRLNKKKEVVNVFSPKMITESLNSVFSILSKFLMGIGSISLLVAGVSILNVMLMSAMERTKEIGIMKAVGASRMDILKMFLLEALFLGIVASIIGGILTFGLSFVVVYLILKDVAYLMTYSSLFYIAEGIFFGVATALIGGMYPAWKAANMRPLDALRHD